MIDKKVWEVLQAWEKPFLTTFSDSDPITKGGRARPPSSRAGSKRQPHATIENAGYFLQEEKGAELARIVVDFVAQTG